MLHGEQSWFLLCRKTIPDLVGAGHRVVYPRLVGFGRSDKPTRCENHTYPRHVEWVRTPALDDLDNQFTPSWSLVYHCRPNTAAATAAPLARR